VGVMAVVLPVEVGEKGGKPSSAGNLEDDQTGISLGQFSQFGFFFKEGIRIF